MSRIRFWLTTVAFAAMISCGAAIAQTPATKTAAATPDSSKPSIETRVETWTKKQWDAAKKEWAKDKAHWTDCRKQSSDQKLTGRKSWSFLYNCMMS